jgi:hypothetical protein
VTQESGFLKKQATLEWEQGLGLAPSLTEADVGLVSIGGCQRVRFTGLIMKLTYYTFSGKSPEMDEGPAPQQEFAKPERRS